MSAPRRPVDTKDIDHATGHVSTAGNQGIEHTLEHPMERGQMTDDEGDEHDSFVLDVLSDMLLGAHLRETDENEI